MNRILSSSALLAASVSMLVSGASLSHAETNVAGVTAAVNPTASALEPSGKRKLISLGDPVVRNQRIETGPQGLVQILLADGTSFTVGPNSSIVIDSFVYDPEKQTASLAATMTKGALRFIGGKASKASGDVTINTPIGTAGIRGAVVDINLDGKTADGQVIPPHVSLVFGKQVELNSRGSSERVFRPGFSIVAGNGGNSVKRTPPLWVSSLQQYLAGRPGQTGGAQTLPTDNSVRNSQVANNNSQQPPAKNSIPVPQPRPLPVTSPEQIAADSTRDTTRPEADGWDGSVGVVYETVDNWGDAELSSGYGQMTRQSDGSWSGTDGDGNTFSLDGITPSETLTSATVTGSSSVLGSLTGSAYAGSGDFIAYLMRSTTDDKPFYVVGGESASMASTFNGTDVLHYVVSEDPASGAVTIGAVNPDLALALDTSDVISSDLLVVGASGTDSSGNTIVGKAIQASLSISGEGSDQTSAINVTAGTFAELTNGGNGLTALSSGGYVTDANTGVTNEQSTAETIGGSEGDDQLFGDDGEYMVIVGSGETYDATANGGLGGTYLNSGANVVSRDDTATETDGTRSFADTTVTGFATGAVTSSGSTELASGTVSWNIDGTTNSFTGAIDVDGVDSGDTNEVYMSSINSQTAYLNDQLIAAAGEIDGSYIVSSEVVPAEIFKNTDGSTTSEICSSCEFMTWGWWGQAEGPESTSSVHLGNWIIAERPTDAEVEQVHQTGGTATYTGNAVGTVVNNGSQYIATGDLNATMDFSARTGTIEISNYDDKDTFGAEVSFESGNTSVSSLTSTSMIGIATSVTGAFASNGTDPVAGIMGSFTAEDGTWSSTGIFAGSR
ncbi:FecR domain-containing protein [Rhizobium glycinendophyticum]|nr:FecR domain-containing protein [Rhizobium glycinendophyticum]